MVENADKRPKIGGWPLTAAIVAVLVFLFYIRTILTPFVLAAALAFVLTPAMDWAQARLRWPRWIFAVLFYVVVLAILTMPLLLFGGQVARDLAETATQLPQMVHKYVGALAKFAGANFGFAIDPDRLSNDILARGQEFLRSGAVLSVAGYGFGAIFGVILFFVVFAYFLISGKQIAAGVFWLVPPEYRREVDIVAAKILPVLWRYFAGLLIIVGYAAVFAWIVFGPIFHVPHAPLIAVTIGLLELIPLIGPTITFAIVGMIAAQQGDLGAVIGLFAFIIAMRLSLDELIAPLVLGRAARLRPIVIIFAFLSGGILFGILGLLLATPIAASIKIILTIYYAEPVAGKPKPRARAAVQRD
jgi:predicted PurR-regulated permease PerM